MAEGPSSPKVSLVADEAVQNQQGACPESRKNISELSLKEKRLIRAYRFSKGVAVANDAHEILQ